MQSPDQQRLCVLCRKKPLRSNNQSGCCSDCRMANGNASAKINELVAIANGSKAPPTAAVAEQPRAPKQPLVAAGVEPQPFDPSKLSDVELASCFGELDRRIEDRAAQLSHLRHLKAQATGNTTNQAQE